MARTRLFSLAQRALADAGAGDGPRALTRRTALLFGGAAALAACAPLERAERFVNRQFAPREHTPDIAIVGGGVAGLTVAYRLAKAGRRATLYEASPRFGGRMFTKHDFNSEGMFCELGGELVDTNHVPLMKLAKEMGVGLQRLKPLTGGGEEIYAFGGRLHTGRELLHHGKGLFVPIAKKIAHDKAGLTDADGNWTDKARTLDGTSVADYLAQFHGHVQPWVLELLDIAYWGEYGVPTTEQSSLNLIDLIGSDPKGEFEMFGASDEVFRIEGGSSSLPDALFAALPEGIEKKPGHALSAIARDGERLMLSFAAHDTRIDVRHDTVVLALPFIKLREVAGIENLGLAPVKLKCIRELGYGNNAKVMVGTTSRPWSDGRARLPAKSGSQFYAGEFQTAWDTSRGQKGERGILTNYLAGVQDPVEALAGMKAGFHKISPAIAKSLDDSNVASFFWARYPFNKGSFSAPKLGQYTTILEAAGTPELDGRLQFAGEHTSSDFPGFMCGGVESGERVAAALLAHEPAHAEAADRRAA